MADYKYSRLADRDLDGIAEYTAINFGIRQARAYRAVIDQSAKTVASFPSMGRPYATQKGTAFFKYNVGEHALFYQPTDTGVLIVRVLHLMMDFDRHLDT
ncbi:MAG: type II toxin-antitoxin system RelE/ParE family toxin [Alphaproteobacteria bacterium]